MCIFDIPFSGHMLQSCLIVCRIQTTKTYKTCINQSSTDYASKIQTMSRSICDTCLELPNTSSNIPQNVRIIINTYRKALSDYRVCVACNIRSMSRTPSTEYHINPHRTWTCNPQLLWKPLGIHLRGFVWCCFWPLEPVQDRPGPHPGSGTLTKPKKSLLGKLLSDHIFYV